MAATPPQRILVVDDDSVLAEACRTILERDGFVIDTESDPFAGRDRALDGAYALLLLDHRMPGLSGLEVLPVVRERCPDLEVIMITGYASIDSAVQAVKLGAFDYVPKPFTPDELRGRVRAALEHRAARQAAGGGTPGPQLIGGSQPVQDLHHLIARIAPTDATVLITGESGTGKELVAIEIHRRSARREHPLISVDCSALAPGLLESELFGHVKGSFTGAVATKPGLFEIADRGTLFLDEVASLSLETQGKLLRVLETAEIKPVGGVDVRRVDIRLIAATNRDLGEMVTAHLFRDDLYYRLNVVPLRLPPLRERPGDVAELCRHFLERYRSPQHPGPMVIAPEAMAALEAHPWPGNVRELRNLIERLVVVTEGDTIRLEHLPAYLVHREPPPVATVPTTNDELKQMKRSVRDRLCQELERAFVIDALRRCSWNVSRAARETGMLRPNFHALMRKHRVRANDGNE